MEPPTLDRPVKRNHEWVLIFETEDPNPNPDPKKPSLFNLPLHIPALTADIERATDPGRVFLAEPNTDTATIWLHPEGCSSIGLLQALLFYDSQGRLQGRHRVITGVLFYGSHLGALTKVEIWEAP